MRYHWISIIGLLLATAAGVFFWWFLITEGLISSGGAPIIFILLLVIIGVSVVVGWAAPDAGILLLIFAGAMLSTYSATTSGRYDLIPGLLMGTPFIVAAILLAIGERLTDIRLDNQSNADSQ